MTDRQFDRRQFVQGAAAVGAAGLAGCTGGQEETPTPTEEPGEEEPAGGDGDGDEEVDGGTGELVDATFREDTGTVPTRMQYNPYNATNTGPMPMVFEPFAQFLWEPDYQFEPLLAGDWEFEAERATITIGDGYTWSDGEPVTSRDLLTKFRLEEFFNHPAWEFISEVNAVDDRTLELTLPEVNPDVARHAVLQMQVDTPHGMYAEWLERLQGADGEAEEDEIVSELLEFAPQEPVTQGPFTPGEVTDREVTLDRHDGYPGADGINFPRWQVRNVGSSNEERWRAVMSDEVDGVCNLFMPPEVSDQMPDHVVEALSVEEHGTAVFFQHDDPDYGDLLVRKAFAHVIDREGAAQSAGGGSPAKGTVERVTGLVPALQEEFIPEEDLAGFEEYETDTERAAALLEEAGYERDGGDWVDENGDRLRAPIKSTSHATDYIAAAQSVISNLEQFGVESELVTIDATTYYGETFPSGDYRLSMYTWGGGQPHPFFSFHELFVGDERAEMNFPDEVEVPMPPGDPDGEPETVNVREKVNALAQEPDDERARELVEELAWIWNQQVPVIPYSLTRDQTIIRTDDWEVPPEDDPVWSVKHPCDWFPRAGLLNAKSD